MIRTSKFRLYPNDKQIKCLEKTFSLNRLVYNCALEERKSYYKIYKKSRSYYAQEKLLPEVKKLFPEIKSVHSQVLQSTLKRLDNAYKAFFDLNFGFPRFKSKDRFRSILYKQSGFSVRETENKEYTRLYLSKIGHIKMRLHRRIIGNIKTCQIIKTSTNKWFVCLSCNEVPKEPLSKTSDFAGIDLGIKEYATISDGETIGNPRYSKKLKNRFKLAQCKLDKLSKVNKRRPAAKLHVARCFEKIKNKRNDFQHKKALDLVRKYDVICIEDLDIKEMMTKSKISKSLNGAIADCAWGNFILKISYKAESADKKLYKVDPRNTSKMCSSCSKIVPKKLSDRIHKCECGLEIDRDLNASYNILNQGMDMHGTTGTRASYFLGE